jgi:hypothetical protein
VVQLNDEKKPGVFAAEATNVILTLPCSPPSEASSSVLQLLPLPDHLFVLRCAPVASASPTQHFPDHSEMADTDFTNADWNAWIDQPIFQSTEVWPPWNTDFSLTPPDDTTNSNSPAPSASPDSTPETKLETTHNSKHNSKKRRQTSECSQPDALIRPRKTRTLRSPHETAKVREKGACLSCKRKRKEVGPVCELLVMSRTV